MTPQQHATRAVATAVLAVATLVAVSGCSVSAEPSPSPTPTAAFSSEEEAFAAAEEVYRAYIDALNQVRFADPNTFDAVYALLSGDASSSTREAFSEFHAEGVTSSGMTAYQDFSGQSFDSDAHSLTAQACLDVSDVEVIARDGTSLVADSRPDLQAMRITFKFEDAAELVIDSMQPDSAYRCDI